MARDRGRSPGWLLTLFAAVALLLVSAPSAVAAAEGDHLSKAQKRAIVSAKIEAYSKSPSGDHPYRGCPPATKRRPGCHLVALPEELLGDEAETSSVLPPLNGSGMLGGYSPADLQDAYNLSTTAGEGIVVADVVANHSQDAESDLAKYRKQYGLPPCTTANGCFKQVQLPGAVQDKNWAREIALDTQLISAACPKCKILLIESNAWHTDVAKANQVAIEEGADVVLNSWYLSEEEKAENLELDQYLSHPSDVVILADSGDDPNPSYPGTSPKVVSVGGTSLYKDSSPRGWEETIWQGAGSGCSALQAKPAWQLDPGCGRRSSADVSAVANVFTGVSIYFGEGNGWEVVGGTSAAGPIIAGLEATKSLAFREGGAKSFYDAARNHEMYDVVTGLNVHCQNTEESYLCEGAPGYDGPTGVGTPGDPLPGPPTAHKQPTLLEPESVMIKGRVNPQGKGTSYVVEYGTTAEYGASAPAIPASAGNGVEAVDVSQRLTGLKPGTLYHYRISASNSTGTYRTPDLTLTTPSAAQLAASTEAPTSVGVQAATLNGAIDGAGTGATYQFEYGPSASYGSSTPAKAAAGGFSTVSESLTDLESGRVYHYRLKVIEGGTTRYGRDYVFRLPPGPPTAVTLPIIRISSGGGTLRGRVTPGGAKATWDFQIVSDAELKAGGWPQYIGERSLSSELEPVDVEFGYGGLERETTYHYRTVAKNSYGTDFGAPETFTTYGWQTRGFSKLSLGRLDGVSCVAKFDCTTVGVNFGQSQVRTVAASILSAGSFEQTTPNPAGAKESRLEDVSCLASGSCLAVGSYLNEAGVAQPLAEVRSGGTWSLVTVPLPAGATSGRLEGASCLAANDCIAVGSYVSSGGATVPLAVGWNGSGLSLQAPKTPAGATKALFHDISCAGGECRVVGESEEAGKGTSALVERVAGGSWTIQSLTSPPPTLGAVSCTSPSWCIAVGSGLQVQTWNGSTWSGSVAPGPAGAESAELADVSCTSATSCTAVGGYKTLSHGVPLVEHWSGSGWQLRGTFDFYEGETVSWSRTLTAVSCVPGYCVAPAVVVNAVSSGAPAYDFHIGLPPTIATDPATVEDRTPTLNGNVDARGADTTYRFEYDTAEYKTGEGPHGTTVPAAGKAIGSEFGSVAVADEIATPLNAGTYHYRLVAESGAGTTYGPDQVLEMHTPRFGAGKYPATLTGTPPSGGNHQLGFEAGSVSCKAVTFTSSLSASASSLSIAPSYSQCSGFGYSSVSVAVNGCTFTQALDGSRWGARFPGTLGIACPAGNEIEIAAGTCKLRIPAQGAAYAVRHTASGDQMRINSEINLTKLKYTKHQDGIGCPLNGTGPMENGSYAGATETTATSGGTAVAALVSGVEFPAGSKFEAEAYPAQLSAGTVAGQAPAFGFENGLTGSCESVSGSGELAAASTQLGLAPAFSGCKGFGFSSGTLSVNGCTLAYTAGSPGSLGVVCPAGQAMTLKASTCTVTIPAQSGLKAVSSQNTESGGLQRLNLVTAVTGLKYVKSIDGIGCPLGGTGEKSDGTWSFGLGLGASGPGGAGVGIRTS